MIPIASDGRPCLLSPRTIKYVEAMIREGNNFIYDSWLRKVREEEAQANRHSAPPQLNQSDLPKIGNRLIALHYPQSDRCAAPMAKAGSLSRVRRPEKGTTSKDRLRRWLEKVQTAFCDFQASRARDAVYGYLEAVLAIVEHYKVRRTTKKLLRHAFKFAHLPFDRNADPFTAIIRCTSGDEVDSKTISKWARGLRYAHREKPRTRLKTFMKEAGGVNACADLYAKYFGPGRRSENS